LTINVSKLPAGTYFIQTTLEDGRSVVRKLVKI
jgi:hypothetical protein